MHHKQTATSSTFNACSSTAFTDHLHKTQKVEMQMLQNFRYRFPHKPPEEPQMLVRTPFKEKTVIQKQEQRKAVQKDVRIDSSALVVGGKLVYLKEQEGEVTKDKRKLMRLLKQNNISYKKYLMGQKQQHLQVIQAHQKGKQQKVVNDYIKKYINMEKTTKIETANNFESTKQQLFLTK